MAVNLNLNPYYDDFDEFKDFHQLLFKPGYAVQARELTQLQTIIQDQIKKFGSHIFQQGSVVIPGNSFADLFTPYVKLETSFNGQEVSRGEFLDEIVVGATTGIRAIVRQTAAATSTDPLTFYLSYLSGSSDGLTTLFQPGEEIFVETNSTLRATVQGISPTGIGSLAFVKTGVFFVNGRFVTVKDSKVIISKYNSIPSCRVLLKITEEIITSNEDDTLLDPASGSYNFAAPGADRLKVSLELTTLPLSTELDDNYIELMRFNQGVLEEHARYPKYSELEKSLARRTYDESGDYVVNGFSINVKEHLKTKYNDGAFIEADGGDRDKFVYVVDNGKAYIKGFEVEKLAKTTLVADKARTASHIKVKDYFSQPIYGQYFFVTNLIKLPNFRAREKVELWSASTGGSKIGTAYVYAIDLLEGDATGQNAVYKLYYHDVSLIGSNKLHNVGRIVYSTTGSAKVLTRYNLININKDFFDVEDSPQDTITNVGSTRTATVHRFVRSDGTLFVFRHDSTKEIPLEGDFITGSGVNTPTATIKSITSSIQQGSLPLIPVNVDSLKSIKNLPAEGSNYNDLEYYTWTNVTVLTNGSGTGESEALTSGTFVQPDSGIVVAAGPSGIVSPSKISLSSSKIIKITNGPANETVTILAQIKKTGADGITPKSKILTSLTLTNVVPSSSVSLTVCDLYKVISITDASGNDVSDSFAIDDGQRDFYYDFARLKLTGPLPSSNLTIQLQYFAHSGSGDFFCVDSYQNSNLGPDYIGRIPSYRSTNTSAIYDLRSVLDFRPRVDGGTGLFSSGGSSLADAPVIDTILSTPVQYYVPRVDSIVLDKSGILKVISGEPNAQPKKPAVPVESLELYSVYVPAYTQSAKSIVASLVSTTRYTMKDISKLETRISSIERLSILNSLENSVVRTDVVDPITGLNRFKSGYLVDNFTNPFLVADSTYTSNSVSYYNNKLGPRKEGFVSAFDIYTANGSTNFQNTNGQYTLPYTEVAFINQNTSTRAITLNPFSAVSWEGILTIGPEFDTAVLNRNTTTNVNIDTPPIVPEVVITPPAPPVVVEPSPPVIPTPAPVVVPEPEVVPNRPPIVYEEPEPAVSFNILPFVSGVATYSLVEGDTVNFVITATSPVSNGETYYWEIVAENGSTITSSDFVGGALTGSFVASYPSSVTVSTTIASDAASEGLEYFSFVIKSNSSPASTGNAIQGYLCTISDAAAPSAPTYSVTTDVYALDYKEGDTVFFYINTTNVPNGTTLYWGIEVTSPSTASATDFDGPTSGSVTINNNTATAAVVLSYDGIVESVEHFRFYVTTSSSPGAAWVARCDVNINDLEIAGPPEPERVNILVWARDIGLVDGLDSGEVNRTAVVVSVRKDEANAINEVLAGHVSDITIDPTQWLDVYARQLIATTEAGSPQWIESVQNAVAYLTSAGYTGTGPGGQIYEMLDAAWNRASAALPNSVGTRKSGQ